MHINLKVALFALEAFHCSLASGHCDEHWYGVRGKRTSHPDDAHAKQNATHEAHSHTAYKLLNAKRGKTTAALAAHACAAAHVAARPQAQAPSQLSQYNRKDANAAN